MTSKLKTDILETVSGSGTIALTNQLSGMTSASVPSGSVLQVLIVEDSTNMTLSSGTYTDTNLTLSITPSSTSNKILAMWGIQGYSEVAGCGWGTQLVRDSTNVFTTSTQYHQYWSSDSNGKRNSSEHKHLDSPNTTSAVTYKVQVSTYQNKTCVFNEDKTQLVLMEIKG